MVIGRVGSIIVYPGIRTIIRRGALASSCTIYSAYGPIPTTTKDFSRIFREPWRVAKYFSILYGGPQITEDGYLFFPGTSISEITISPPSAFVNNVGLIP
jgi:hypothetical protein